MDILKPLVDNIISSKTDRHVADLRHHLQLLETAAQSTKIDPQVCGYFVFTASQT